MIELKETLETRVSRLGNYLVRAYKHNKSSILFAMYLSEFLRSDVEKSLEKFLKEQGLKVVRVDAGEYKDIPSYIASMNSNNTVFLVYNMKKGFPEALQFLNFKREELIEHHAKVVFWVEKEELTRITNEAPDFFAFRNRVVEFMEAPLVEELKPSLEFALETEYISLEEIKRDVELKEKLLSEHSGEDKISGYLLGSLGILYNQIGSFKKSIVYSEKALKIAQEIGDRQSEGTWLGNIGFAYRALGEVKKAIGYLENALKVAQEIGDRRGEGAALRHLGFAYSDIGEVRKAIGYLENALKVAQEIGDRWGEGEALRNIGRVYIIIGEVRKAIEFYENVLEIAREVEDKKSEAASFRDLAHAYSFMGDVRKAIGYLENALKIEQEIGDRGGEGLTLGYIGRAYQSLGEARKAIEFYENALKIAREIGDIGGEGAALGYIGQAYQSLGEARKAIEFYENTLKIAREIGSRYGEYAAFDNLRSAYQDLGDIQKFFEYSDKALKIEQEIGNKRIESIRLGESGIFYLFEGEIRKNREKAIGAIGDIGYDEKYSVASSSYSYKKAIEYSEKALKIAQEIGDRKIESAWLNNLGEAFYGEEKYKEALACYLMAKEIRIEIEDWKLKQTESNLAELKKELGEIEFEKLEAEVAPRAAEIVRKILEKTSV